MTTSPSRFRGVVGTKTAGSYGNTTADVPRELAGTPSRAVAELPK